MGESNRDERARGTLQRGGKNVPLPKSGEGKLAPLSDAEVAKAYEEEMKGPQGVSFALRDDHLLARAHRTLMLEAHERTLSIVDGPGSDSWKLATIRAQARAAIKAATGGEP